MTAQTTVRANDDFSVRASMRDPPAPSRRALAARLGARVTPAPAAGARIQDSVSEYRPCRTLRRGGAVRPASRRQARPTGGRSEQPGIEILLTDVVMPGENGRALVDSIRDAYPNLIVLFMTGCTRNAIVHNGMLDPGVRLPSKPFTVSDLARELQAALEEKRPSYASPSKAVSDTRAGSS